MYWKLCSVGLIALAGCTGTPSEAPKAAVQTEPAPKSAVAGQSYTLSVPNMT
jgi:hypothetical protein